MPCFYTGSAEGDARYAADEASKRAAKYKKELDRLTDLLCKAGRARHNGIVPPVEVRKWWAEHRCQDAKRGEEW